MFLGRLFFMSALVTVVTGIQAATVVSIFGLPLDGKLPYKLKTCPSTDEICWKEPPTKGSDGSLTGVIQIQLTKNLPVWVDLGSVWIWQKNSGELRELHITRLQRSEASVIEKSISTRFGPATRQKSIENGRYLTWDLPEVEISLDCASDCTVGFVSSSLVRERVIADQKYRAQEAARPASP